MSDLSPEEVKYNEEYAAAMAQLDSAEAGVKPATITEEAKADPGIQEEVKAEPEAKAEVVTEEPAETIAEMRIRLDKAEKALKDTQAWGTKNAQQLAEFRRQQEQAQRDASRPAILDANPELTEAIKYVANDPAPQQAAEQARNTWLQTIESVHPGIFNADADADLVNALVAKRDANPDAWDDPLVAIRDISAEKVAHAERVAGKRFAIEADKLKAKSAMSVPGTGGNPVRTPADSSQDEANRIKNMTDAEFDKYKRSKGF